jgi:hypothetical protein
VRRSPPRLAKNGIEIFLHKIIYGKISSSSDIIHNVQKTATLQDLTKLVLLQILSDDSDTYVPAKGMCWIRKGNEAACVHEN